MTQNILQEIDEDLERQKIEALWKRYSVYVYVLAGAIVIGAAAMTGWHSHREQKEQKASLALIEILDDKNADTSKQIAELETFAQRNYGEAQAVIARLDAAGLAVKSGDLAKAVTLYDAVSSDTKADPFFRQLADLMAVQAQMDTADPVILQKRLQPLLADNAPWRFTAKEYAAFLALRAGDKAKAKQYFVELSQDATVPKSLAERATDMLRYINE